MDKSYPEAIEYFVEGNRNVVFLDTCSILDVLRSPFSWSKSFDQIELLRSFEKYLSDENNCKKESVTVTPSIIKFEYGRNLISTGETFKIESSKIIRHYKTLFNIDKDTFKIAHGMEREGVVPELDVDKIFNNYEIIVNNIFFNSVNLVETENLSEQLRLKAFHRDIKCIPPSNKGKSASADCFIFEEILHISKELRDIGFSKKIIFVSSNTKEFKKDEVENELSELNVEYYSNFICAMNVLTRKNE